MRPPRAARGATPRRLVVVAGTAAAMCVWSVSPVCAQATLSGTPELTSKWDYHLFNPTPNERMRSLSTDRPDATESPYTVDAGHFQIELSFVDYTRDRNNDEAETRTSFNVLPVLVKVGLLNNVDIQIGLDPYTSERVTNRADDTTHTLEGFGDTVVRLKVNLWGNDDGETALAVMPFVKLPTAERDLGNGNVEGGVIVPFAVALPSEFSLGLMAEFDVNRSAADERYVVDFVHTATVARAIVADLGGFVEFAGLLNLNGDEDYRAFFNCGLTYGLNDDVQLDAGVRAGLTEATDDFGVFAGVSWRF